MLLIVLLEEFRKPIRVSSSPSNGPWLGSPRILFALSVICIKIPQLVSWPTAGHSGNGACGAAAAAAAGAAEPVAAALR